MSEALLPPSLADRFVQPSLLGRGAFGRVVRALDATLDRAVAIKVLEQKEGTGDRVEERFLREAKLTAEVKSPFVTQVYDYGMADGSPYIVFQFIDGPSLKTYLVDRGGTLPVEEATELLIDVLEGLVAVHARGVVHRDLKPDNILIAPGPRAVLADFGLGRGKRDRRLTGTGMVVGTGEYMAPEQMRGSEPSPDMDLYAAGVIYHLLLTGEPPFVAGTFVEMFERKMEGLKRGLRDQGVPVPMAADHVLERLLAPDRDERARSARLALQALHDAFKKARRDGEVSYPSLAARAVLSESAVVGGSTAVFERLSGVFAAVPAWRIAMVSASLAAAVGLGFVLAAGWYHAAPPGAGGPAAVVRETPDPRPPDVEELGRNLRGLVADLEEHPQVREALLVSDDVDRRNVRAVWEAGRAVFAERLADAAPLVAALGDRAPDLRGAAALSDLALLDALMTHSRFEERATAAAGAAGPGLAAVLGRVLRVERVASLDGQFPADPGERSALFRSRLAEGGRRWATLRRLEDLFEDVASRRVLLDRLRRVSYFGEPFEETSKELPVYLRDSARDVFGVVQDSRAPLHIGLDLAPFQGDLVLALALRGWDETVSGMLEILGRDRTVRLFFRPPRLLAMPEKEGRVWVVGAGIRVAQAALPAGARRVRVSARGIQAVGTPILSVEVGEVHQLTGGPLPDELVGP